jgi:hypothetical protein
VAARLIGFSILGIAALVCLLAAVYLVTRALDRSKAAPELDVSVRPSMWWADTKAIRNGTMTEVSIVRVDNRTHEILERRILDHLRNEDVDYSDQLDRAQDAAYEATRKANLGLNRR